MKLLEVIDNTNRMKRELNDLASTVDAEIKKINDYYNNQMSLLEAEKKKKLSNLNVTAKRDRDVILDSFCCDCSHDVVIKTLPKFTVIGVIYELVSRG